MKKKPMIDLFRISKDLKEECSCHCHIDGLREGWTHCRHCKQEPKECICKPGRSVATYECPIHGDRANGVRQEDIKASSEAGNVEEVGDWEEVLKKYLKSEAHKYNCTAWDEGQWLKQFIRDLLKDAEKSAMLRMTRYLKQKHKAELKTQREEIRKGVIKNHNLGPEWLLKYLNELGEIR